MNTNTPFKFDFNATLFLYSARQKCQHLGLDCISNIICLITAMLDNESEEHANLIKKGIDSATIEDVADTIIGEHLDTLAKQKKFFEIHISDCEKDQIFNVSKEVYDIFVLAEKIAQNIYGIDYISYVQIVDATRDAMPHTFDRFVKLCIHAHDEKKASELGHFNINLVVPAEIANCLTILNNNYSPDEKYCRILGREKETKKLTAILAKTTKRNAILVGEPGVGKSAIMDKLAWEIVTHNAPKVFEDSIMLLLDINAMIAGTTYRGEAEEKFEILKQFLEEHPEVILCIDEVHTMLGAGACKEGEMDLANTLKPILARGDTRVIGATTQSEYEKYFSSDGALKRRFERVNIPEPLIEEVYPMIKNQIRYLTENHKVTISKDLVDKIIFYASAFNYETRNPDRSLDLVDKTMATAKLDGRKEATLEDVLCNFDTSMERYEVMTVYQKKLISSHESGHCIVDFFAPELTNMRTVLVSVIPGNGTGGVNVCEPKKNVMVLGGRDYYVQYIASMLGGRVAEEMYTSKLTDGAKNDLIVATKYAEKVVMEYGLVEEFTRTRVYPNGKENPFFTHEVARDANVAINNLLKEAENYARNLLNEKKEYLEALIGELLDNGMMSGEEIEELFRKIDFKKK